MPIWATGTLSISRARPSRAAAKSRGGFYGDVQDRALIEAVAKEHPFPPEYEYLKEGCTVRHSKFGVGKVITLSQPWPETRATINFEGWGTKKIVLSKTSLELA